MDSFIIVAPVGDRIDNIAISFKAVPPEKVILLSPEQNLEDAKKTKRNLEANSLPTDVITIRGNIWEEMFRVVGELKQAYPEDKIVINTATGDRVSTCAATSAAFVNGLKALSMGGKQPMLLPVLKFDYYKIISEKKMNLLKKIEEKGGEMSFEDLSKELKLSSPLLSYYINGNLKTEGLKDLGLVKVKEQNNKKFIILSLLAKMLLKGYIDKKVKQ